MSEQHKIAFTDPRHSKSQIIKLIIQKLVNPITHGQSDKRQLKRGGVRGHNGLDHFKSNRTTKNTCKMIVVGNCSMRLMGYLGLFRKSHVVSTLNFVKRLVESNPGHYGPHR